MKKALLIFFLSFVFSQVSAQGTIWTETTKFRGFIGKYEIGMVLAVPFGGLTQCFSIGEYYYVSTKKKISLCSDENEILYETVDGKQTGYFILNENWNKRLGQVVLGNWYSMDGKRTYPVTLKVVAKGK